MTHGVVEEAAGHIAHVVNGRSLRVSACDHQQLDLPNIAILNRLSERPVVRGKATIEADLERTLKAFEASEACIDQVDAGSDGAFRRKSPCWHARLP